MTPTDTAALPSPKGLRQASRAAHTPGPFVVSEDDLTDALFNSAALASSGAGTKAEARTQARVMLAGADLLAALEALYDPVDGPCRAVRPGDWPVHDRARAALAKGSDK